MLNPIIKWSGGKKDEIKQFIPEKYDLYLEPFVGGGSVFFIYNLKNLLYQMFIKN